MEVSGKRGFRHHLIVRVVKISRGGCNCRFSTRLSQNCHGLCYVPEGCFLISQQTHAFTMYKGHMSEQCWQCILVRGCDSAAQNMLCARHSVQAQDTVCNPRSTKTSKLTGCFFTICRPWFTGKLAPLAFLNTNIFRVACLFRNEEEKCSVAFEACILRPTPGCKSCSQVF